MADLNIRINVDDAQAKRALADVDRQLDGIADSGAEAGKGADNMMKALLKTEGVKESLRQIEQGFQNIAKFSGKSLESFGAQESAIKKLTTALQAQGTATPAVIKQYEALAATFQKTTTFSDELITEMQALLTQVGNVMPKQMGGALKAATDLAAGLDIDLRTATMLVGKAFAGETGTLKRYGIVIDETKLKTDAAGAVMEAINKKFGGQAQAQLDTYNGKMANLGNRFDDFKEQVGETIARALTPILNLFGKLPQPVQTFTFAVTTLTVVLGPLVAGVAGLIASLGGGPIAMGYLTTATGAVTGAFSTMWGMLSGLVIPILGGVGLAIGTLMAFFPPLQAAIDAIRFIWKNWDQIKPIVMGVYDAVKLYMVDKFNAIVASIQQKVDAVIGFFQKMYDQVVGHSFVPDMIRGIGTEFSKLGGLMVAPTEQATGKVAQSFQRLSDGVIGGLVRGDARSALGAVKQFATETAASLLEMIPVVGPFLAKFAKPIVDGLIVIGQKLKGLFGGPDAKEIAGREVVKEFAKNIDLMLTNAQKIEAGNEEWKKTVIVVRDAYLAIGKTEQEALADVKAMWEAEKYGADAAKAAVDRINDVLRRIPRPEAPWSDWPDPPKVPDYDGNNNEAHAGGLIGTHGLARYHSGGLMPDERVIIGQTGEGILNRRAMANMGASELHARNRGATPGGVVNQVTVYASGEYNSLSARRRLGQTVRDVLDGDIQLKRKARAR